jgi:demethylspheroidene O-methyltransferase
MPGMSMLLTWRDRLLADSGFQRWSARFPLTRRVARREARALFDICAGFTYSQVLTACLELDLFARVAERPMQVAALALFCEVPEPAMRMLVDAAASLRLLKIRNDEVRLGALGAALRGNPGIAAMVAHHRLFYADISDPVALLAVFCARSRSKPPLPACSFLICRRWPPSLQAASGRLG